MNDYTFVDLEEAAQIGVFNVAVHDDGIVCFDDFAEGDRGYVEIALGKPRPRH